MSREFVINLEEVTIEKDHPYTLVFKGYIPAYSSNRLYTFRYDGQIAYSDAYMDEEVKENFAEQLKKDYGYAKKFELKEVQKKLKEKRQYGMKM